MDSSCKNKVNIKSTLSEIGESQTHDNTVESTEVAPPFSELNWNFTMTSSAESKFDEQCKLLSTELKQNPTNPDNFELEVLGTELELLLPVLNYSFTMYDQKRYSLIFSGLTENNNGFVSASAVKDFLCKNNYLVNDFDFIWNLCDPNLSGKLLIKQFTIFMWLMEQNERGIEIPACLNETGIQEIFSDALSKSSLDDLFFENTSTEESSNKLKHKDINEEIEAERLSMLKTFQQMQIQTGEFQNALFDQEQALLYEQKENNRCFLRLKSFREQTIALQEKCADGIKTIRNVIFELENKILPKTFCNDKASSNTQDYYDIDSQIFNSSWNPFDSSDEDNALNNSSSQQSLSSKSTNPFYECAEHSSSIFGPYIPRDTQSTPLLCSSGFDELVDDGNIVDFTEYLSLSPEAKIPLSPSTVHLLNDNDEGYNLLGSDSKISETIVEEKPN